MEAAQSRSWRVVLGLMGLTLLPRLLVFPVNESWFGDAVIRTELAERWLRHPHWISSFHDGAYQFGPLHLYLLALALKVFPREDAGRWLSLLAGVLTVIPLYQLTQRLFGPRAALWACLAFAVWGMHIQFSTTGASEALGVCLVMWALASFAKGMASPRVGPLFASAALMNLACATRYDTWLLIPVLCGVLLFKGKDRAARVTRAVLFGLACLPFPLLWMHGNEVATGDALFPMSFIDAFHKGWVGDAIGRYGEWGFRVQSLFFWPGAAVFTLTPLVAFLGGVGMWWKRREQAWLLWVALVPTAYFAFRGAVLANFSPLGRFTASQVVLLLPFVEPGFEALLGAAPLVPRRIFLGLTGAVAVGFTVWLGWFTLHDDSALPSTLKPVSPVSTNPVAAMQVAHFMKSVVGPGDGGVILDADGQYMDLQIGFFGGLPETRMARARWEDFPKLLASSNPRYLVRGEGGWLDLSPDFRLEAPGATFRGMTFEELPGFTRPFHVYRRVEGPLDRLDQSGSAQVESRGAESSATDRTP